MGVVGATVSSSWAASTSLITVGEGVIITHISHPDSPPDSPTATSPAAGLPAGLPAGLGSLGQDIVEKENLEFTQADKGNLVPGWLARGSVCSSSSWLPPSSLLSTLSRH